MSSKRSPAVPRPRPARRRAERLLTLLGALLLAATMPDAASAAVSVGRAEVSGTALRLEGTAIADRDITVDGAVLGRSDGAGRFRIERNPFTAPADCTVDVNDGSASAASARLTGCTTGPPTPPPPGDTTAPSVPAGLSATLTGTTANLAWSASTDDVAVAGYRVRRNGTAISGLVTGTTFADPGLPGGSFTYTVAAVDAAGNVSAESAGVSVTVASTGLSFITPAQLLDAVVGQPYLGYIVVNDPPGPSTFRFKLVSGRVPAGTRFVENTLENRPEARVVGTPTTAGTSSFTVEVQDNTGARVSRTFSVRVLAR